MVVGKDKFILNVEKDRELYKMSNIWRYSGRLIQKPENLAEHSFYVAFKVLELGSHFNIPEDKIIKALRIALCHDIGEIYTGDLPHNLKMYSPKIKEISEQLEVELISKNFEFFSNDFKDFADRKDEIVCTLVDLADCADVLMFIDREELLGNKHEDIMQIRTECYERFTRISMKLEQLTVQYNKTDK